MEEEVRSEGRIITHNTYTTAGVFFVVLSVVTFFFFFNASFYLFLGVLLRLGLRG